MKHELKISRLAMICALCATAACPAFGAASVRSLGGAGTYSSASSAATAKTGSSATKSTGGATAARAGSMRVSPTTNGATKAVSSNGATAGSTARAAGTQRLSIGKYLGGGASLSGGSSIKNQASGSVSSSSNSGGSNPALASDLDSLNKRVDSINATVAAMYDRDELNGVLDNKQDKLKSKDAYVVVDGADIYLDVDNLSDALQESLAGQGGAVAGDVQIEADDKGIKWRQGDGEWVYLSEWKDLTGPQGEKGEPGDGLDAETLNAAVKTAVDSATENFLTAADLPTKVSELVNDAGYITDAALGDYAKTADVELKYATKEQLDAAQLGGDVDLTAYVKTEAMNAALADKADKSALESVSGEMDTINGLISDASDAASDALTAATNAGAAATAAQNTADAAMASLGDKADKSAIPTKVGQLENDEGYITNAALGDYAKTADVDAKYATKEALDAAQLGGDVDLTAYAKTADIEEKYATKESLGALATKDTVAAEQIENGAITADKLAESVQTSLDNAITTTGVDMSKNQVLAIYDGKQTWLEIAE